MDSSDLPSQPRIGLVMTGGGARAAYQVGVLRAISMMLPAGSPSPFSIICGTSAGAVNATVLAANASNFRRGVRQLMTVWKNFHVHHVYRADPLGVIYNSGKWILAVLTGGLGRETPISLLDNLPFAHLLNTRLDFGAIQRSIDRGDLYAFSVTCSGYTSGQSVTFYQGVPGLEPWQRARRIGIPAKIGPEHLLASSALPFIFPAAHINREYFGDGSIRQVDFRLISPSIALEKIAIGHMHTLPRTIRTLLFTLGALKKSGSNLVSYLLFEREYCRALIKLGYDDTMQRRDDLMQFLGYEACWL